MAPLLSFHPHQTLIPTSSLLSSRQIQTRIQFLGRPAIFSRGSLTTRLGSSNYHHQLEELLSRADGFLYTIADAAVASAQESKPTEDWFSGIASYMEIILKILKDGLSTLHVPYAYGFAIILLTVLVKAATFPLTKKQMESALAMKTLQPQVKAIQQQYAGDQEKIQLETARLYKVAGVNPLAGCLPTLLTIPVWIGLYRALSNVANEGLLSEGFFWVPSLAGPTTIAARQNGSGISWLFPFEDGEPPLGWSDTLAYLVLPVLLVISQLTNNILSTAQQIWLHKHGGAKSPVKEYTEMVSRDEQIPTIDVLKPRIEKSMSSQDSLVRRGERFKQIKEEEERRKKLKLESDALGQRFKQIKEEEERRRKEKEEEREREKEKDNDSLTIVEEKSNHEELNEGETDNMPFSLNGGLGHISDESVTDGTNQNGGSS
ncbi:ALBINO3-like protein 1 [Carex littledalei]|uniref:ALBINO3-like protein 1 n=1 Tax=Carex littledalei TaxID=544730 RepID=A0A833RJ93_9POAL|nr:ALBINO3-like protein 1 [Carex littledalei]